MMVVLLVKDDITDKHLHPYIESRTLRVYMYVYYGQAVKETDFHTTKIDEPFGVRFHFLKIFGNQCRSMRGSYFWLRTTHLYTSHVEFGTLGVFHSMYVMVTSVPTKR